MKIKLALLTLSITVLGLLGSISSAFACSTLGNQEECPNEFIR